VNRLIDGYCRRLEALIALMLAIMVVLVFGNVVLRYGFNSGITMSEEVSRWLFVWLTVINDHQYNPQAVIVSKKLWDTLSNDEKKIFADAAAEAAKYELQVSREQATVALENLKKNGMQVTEFNAAEMAKFRDKMKPVIEKHSAIVGNDTVAALQAELAKQRK